MAASTFGTAVAFAHARVRRQFVYSAIASRLQVAESSSVWRKRCFGIFFFSSNQSSLVDVTPLEITSTVFSMGRLRGALTPFISLSQSQRYLNYSCGGKYKSCLFSCVPATNSSLPVVHWRGGGEGPYSHTVRARVRVAFVWYA